jgi:hypothetical protein
MFCVALSIEFLQYCDLNEEKFLTPLCWLKTKACQHQIIFYDSTASNGWQT